MTISENEYRLLNVILQEPHLSYTEIAQKLDLSVTSIRNLLFSLMDYSETEGLDEENTTLSISTNDYKNNNPKKTHNLSFFAKFNYDLLDLQRFDFFITCKDTEQFAFVRTFCDAHPYTAYRTRLHGGENGLYVTFCIPPETHNMLLYSLDVLKKNNKIVNFRQIFQNKGINIFSNLKVDVFDINRNKWNFNFEQSFKGFKLKHENEKLPNIFELKNDSPIIKNFDKIDLLVLNEWGYGAGPRKTKAEILNNVTSGKLYQNFIQDLKINRYIVSDHVDSLLKSNIIEYVGIGFDRRKIQIFTTLFYFGEADANFLNLFANYVKSDDFPFESRLSIGDVVDNKAKFSWWASFTPAIVSEVTEFLFLNCHALTTFIVTINSIDNETYPLYHANFIPNSDIGGSWNKSEEYCLKNPLHQFFSGSNLDNILKEFVNFQKNK